MSREFVFESSPLILLTRVGRLDLVDRDRETIPQSVFREIEAGSAVDDTPKILQSRSHLTVVPDVAVPAEIRLRDLERGETHTLSLCGQPGALSRTGRPRGPPLRKVSKDF